MLPLVTCWKTHRTRLLEDRPSRQVFLPAALSLGLSRLPIRTQHVSYQFSRTPLNQSSMTVKLLSCSQIASWAQLCSLSYIPGFCLFLLFSFFFSTWNLTNLSRYCRWIHFPMSPDTAALVLCGVPHPLGNPQDGTLDSWRREGVRSYCVCCVSFCIHSFLPNNTAAANALRIMQMASKVKCGISYLCVVSSMFRNYWLVVCFLICW